MSDRAVEASEKSPYLPEEAGGLRAGLSRAKFSAAYRVWKRVIDRYAERPVERMLEVGCGPGNFARCLQAWFGAARLTALDLEDDLIRYARNQAGRVRFVRGSSERLPFESGSFEVVSALQVIEHFPRPEDFLAEVHRVLEPGGLFLMATPNTEGLSARYLGERWQGIRDDHISLRAPSEWQRAVDDAGFDRLSEGTTLFNGLPVLGRPPLALPFLALQSIFGWFPWQKGESYMLVARRSA